MRDNPAWLKAADEPIWERAKDQVARQRGRRKTRTGWALQPEDWPLVTYIFKQMGGTPMRKKNPSEQELRDWWLSWK